MLRAIEDLLKIEAVCQNGRLNFEPSSYTNEQNKEQPMYLLNREAYWLVVMGFTGEEAMRWKLRFIEAFNRLEEIVKAEIQNQQRSLSRCGHFKALIFGRFDQEQKDRCRAKAASLVSNQ